MPEATERTESFRFDLSKAERADLQALAVLDGVSMADVLRGMIRKAAQARVFVLASSCNELEGEIQ